MCGFTGWVHDDPRREVDPVLLRRMTRTLVHRGPDGEGYFEQGGVALGFRRLAIVDLAAGDQPFVSACGRVALVGNGELYNHAGLREELLERGASFRSRSDMEVALQLYLHEGPGMLERLEGMFALAVVDLRTPGQPRTLLARDRLGLKPLYWARRDGALWFASEAKALLASGRFPRRLRGEALVHYLQRGHVGGRHSAWEDIHCLRPGHLIDVAVDEPVVPRAWWSPPDEAPGPRDRKDEVLEHLDRAVEARLMADVPLGGFLSGGVDSAGVADAMARGADGPPRLCTVSFEEEAFDEVELARLTASRLGATHEVAVQRPDPTAALEVLPWHFDEPHADPSDLATWLVSRTARESVTVALSGDGGDEVFGGYRRYLHEVWEARVRGALGPLRGLAGLAGALHPTVHGGPAFLRGKTFLQRVGADPARAAFDSAAVLTRAEVDALLHPSLRQELRGHDAFAAWAVHYAAPRTTCPLFRTQYADLQTTLPDQLLVKVDRASMAVGLEVRVPLLDHRLVERFLGLPLDRKVCGGVGKVALREALGTRLEPRVLSGRKRGFDIPLASWLRGPLRSALRDHLSSLPPRWFDAGAVERLEREHASGRRDHALTLWGLLVLEAWRRRHDCEELAA